MARTRSATSLAVYLNGRRVGTLTRAASGAVDFRYEASWLGWQSAFAISHALPLREDRYVGATVAAVFDNLLPDQRVILLLLYPWELNHFYLYRLLKHPKIIRFFYHDRLDQQQIRFHLDERDEYHHTLNWMNY